VDLSDLVAVLFVVAIVVLVIVFALSDIAIAFLIQKVLEPFVRWFQRVFLGIDCVRIGDEALLGSVAIAGSFRQSEDNSYVGSVLVDGETWSARAGLPVREGETVSITGRENLMLIVEPTETE